MTHRIVLDYYTDVLCIWAYVAQVRLEQLQQDFSGRIVINHKLISIFGDTRKSIGENPQKGGFEKYSRKVQKVASHFDHVNIHPHVWTGDVPASCLPAHLYLKAVQLLENRGEVSSEPQGELGGRTLFEALNRGIRETFFVGARNVARKTVLDAVAEELGLSLAAIDAEIASGRAYAMLSADMQESRDRMIEGSPTYVMNDGRQKLYGNIGYLPIAANIRELLERKDDLPSWC